MNSAQKVAAPIKIPLWITGFYALFSLSMGIWITHLLQSLPAEHLGIHWRVMWTVFDAALLVQGLLAAYLLYRKSVWAALPLVSLATLFVVDMWFDVMTSVTGVERAAALKLTVSAEIPLAILSLGCAIYILRQAVKSR